MRRSGTNAVENNELVQYTSEAIFEKEAKKLKKQEEEIKAKVCTKNMSQSACNKAYRAERDRINEETNKTVVGIVTNIPAIGVIDSGENNIRRKFISWRRNKSTMGCCRNNFLRQWPES